jgi:hypothetical protein
MTPQEAADYIGALLDGLRLVAHNANLPLPRLSHAVTLEEATSTRAGRERRRIAVLADRDEARAEPFGAASSALASSSLQR